MQKIIPYLWFDKEAKEASDFYTAIFPDSKIIHYGKLKDTPSGDNDFVYFQVFGYSLAAISAGPIFKINPSISFFINFDPSTDKDARKNLEKTWQKLSDGGVALMPLQKYDFSELYGWIQDKYGVSWQLILSNPTSEKRPVIVPSLMFTQNLAGKAEEAINFYASVFKNSKTGTVARYPEGMPLDKEGTLMFADFMIENQWFAAMDSAQNHKFIFNEAVSLLVQCDSQKEIDYYWDKLSAVPESEQCGWLKDKFGVSWQIAPSAMQEMLTNGSLEQIAAVTKAFMPMKKLNLAELEKAYNNPQT